MRSLLAIVLLLLCTVPVSHAAFFYKSEKFIVAGTDAVCETELPLDLVLSAASAGLDVNSAKQALVVQGDDSAHACWIQTGANEVFIMDERGGYGFLKIGDGV